MKSPEQRRGSEEFNPDPAKPNSVELIIRQGHGVNRVARVKTTMSDMTLWGTKFEAFMTEVSLECRRGLK